MTGVTAKQDNVDYAVQARTALAAVERLTTDIDDVPRKTTQCREKWRDYGAALLEQRKLMPSDQRFGRWVKEHGLDQGLASHSVTRSNAMWVAEHFDSLGRSYTGNSHHPDRIRQECRDAGFEWAGETAHQKERKAKSVRKKAKARQYSCIDVMADEGLMPSVKQGGSAQKWKAVIAERFPVIDLKDPEQESDLRRACQILLAERQPESVTTAVAESRETVNESARVRFDKAVAKVSASYEGAYQARLAALQRDYESTVQKEVAKRAEPFLEAERERLREAVARNEQEWQNFLARKNGIKQAMTRKEFQLLLNCLHPDRAPADRTDRFTEAFRIAKRLKPYIDAFED
jgi:hypothetical protein